MRFTKIPLIATLMAVALSLLIVLPTLAQVSGDRTDGRQSVGKWLDVRVADDLADILPDGSTDTTIGTTARALGATAFDARDTYFDGNLYVSNQAGSVHATDPRSNAAGDTVLADYEYAFAEAGAYNTVLITASVATASVLTALPGPDGKLVDDPGTTGVDETADNIDCTVGGTTGVAVATIKNLRTSGSVTAYLVDTGTGATNDPGNIFQGLVTVWDQEDGFDAHNGPCGDHGTPTRFRDPYNHLTAGQRQSSTNNGTPIANKPADGWTDGTAYPAGPSGTTNTTNSGAVIPARDGDTLVITVDGVAGSIELVVDGQGPDIDDVTPEQGGTQKSSTVNLGFTVTDDGSGIRYDAESGISGDPDLTPHNGDNDNRFDEPITSVGDNHDPAAAVFHWGNGSTEDIKIRFGTTDAITDADDVSQYSSNGWTQRMRGVTYDLDMQLVGKSFDKYYWQVTAKDRVGNMAVTDADEDKPSDQPYSFNVDDRSPKVRTARTGIGYEPGEGEFRSRSWIALNFENVTKAGEFEGGADRIDAGTVAPGDFTVKGHTVMNVVVPSDKKVCVGDDPRTPKDKEDESDGNIIGLDAGPGDPAEDEDGDVIAGAKAPSMCNFEPRARVYLELAGGSSPHPTRPPPPPPGARLPRTGGRTRLRRDAHHPAARWRAPGHRRQQQRHTVRRGRAGQDRAGREHHRHQQHRHDRPRRHERQGLVHRAHHLGRGSGQVPAPLVRHHQGDRLRREGCRCRRSYRSDDRRRDAFPRSLRH